MVRFMEEGKEIVKIRLWESLHTPLDTAAN